MKSIINKKWNKKMDQFWKLYNEFCSEEFSEEIGICEAKENEILNGKSKYASEAEENYINHVVTFFGLVKEQADDYGYTS